MLVLGLQGSPRRRGNTHFLLSTFLEAAERRGAQTQVIDAGRKNIEPCREYILCEKKGFCPIDDDMTREIYGRLRQADVIVLASPVFFYNVTAQLKALIDRSQTLWARKYKLKLTDPGRAFRRGYVLAVGATRGKNLFEGIDLTAKYFFDAAGADYVGSLTYRRIEAKGDMEKHPTVIEDVRAAVDTLLGPLLGRKSVLFHGRRDACRSQMACAFAQYLGGDRIEALSAANSPAPETDPLMVDVMQEKGIDMAFRKPRSTADLLLARRPDVVVCMDADGPGDPAAGTADLTWDLPDTEGKSIDFLRAVRDDIERKVTGMIARIGAEAGR